MRVEILKPSDYDSIIVHLNEWWGGRNVVDMLPRLFFKHFSNTSFVIKKGDCVVGFIIAFISPTESAKAYVHFIGVNPTMRGRQIGKILYESLFKAIRELGIKEVECVTSIKNETSIDFHKKIGFTIVPTDTIDESGMCYHPDYDGPGEHRILFNYQL